MADLCNASSDEESQEMTKMPGTTAVAFAPPDLRIGFVRKVYGILSAQLVLTVLVAAPFQKLDPSWLRGNQWLLYLSFGVTLSTVCALVCCRDIARRYPSNYILLFVFTFFEGITVGFFSAAFTWQSVLLAAGITVLVFLMLTTYACLTTTDFTGAGPYLVGALSCLCTFGFVLSLMTLCGVNIQAAMMFYDALGVLIFVFYIIYDTQLILGSGKGHQFQFELDDYVFAALNLYLDIINLFLHILSLLGDRR